MQIPAHPPGLTVEHPSSDKRGLRRKSISLGQRHKPGTNRAATAFLYFGVFVAMLAVSPARATDYDCLIEPTQTVELASPVTGLLDRVLVKRGDKVAKGQAVAALESKAEQFAADLAKFRSELLGPTRTAESKIEFAKRKFQRRKEMSAEKLLAVQERDDAEAELKLAEAELLVAGENRQLARIEYQQQSSVLALRTIRSTVDGVVLDQLAYPGEVVEATGAKKVILKVAQLHPLRVHVILPMNVFGKISQDAIVEVSPERPVGGRHTARVKTIDKVIDAASGTFAVFLDMPNPKLEVPSGAKCRASIKSSG